MQGVCGTCPEVVISYDQSVFDVAIAWNYDPTSQTVEIYHASEPGVTPTAGIQLNATCSSDPSVEFLFTEVLQSNADLPAVISNNVSSKASGPGFCVYQRVWRVIRTSLVCVTGRAIPTLFCSSQRRASSSSLAYKSLLFSHIP